MKWEKVLRESVKDGKIKKANLIAIPVLKNCPDWRDVKILGWIDCNVKTIHYQGLLVHLNDNLYFVKQATYNALRDYLSTKHIVKIEVVD